MKHNYTIKRTLSAMLLLMMSTLSWAYSFQVDGIYYNINYDGKSVEVTYKDTHYGSYSGDIVIPPTVTYNNNTYMVTSIGEEAFYKCSSLTSISIPESVTSIGEYAFYNCSSLTSISIPKSVTSIGDRAFYWCYSLTSISIPEGVTSIGNYAFSGCWSFKSITVAANNPVYDSRGGCNAIIETSSNKLIAGCKNTIIPESVTSIGDYAFYNCRSLTSISIPKSVKSIGDEAFWYCESLTSISIAEGVTSIGEYAFYYCRSLTSIYIPKSVTSIGDYAFYGCSSLTSIYIPEGVTSIGNYAFRGCSSLTSISIPEGVKSIGNYAFYNCSSLTSISIPEGVMSIGDGAFWDCSSLSSISIPGSVTSIGECAFFNCSSLTSITCYAEKVPTLGGSVFYNVPKSEATLYVPASALADYKAAYQWKDFGRILPLEDNPAGISNIKADETNAPYYTLDGVRVDTPTHKGIYIRNSKKILIK